MIAVKLNNSRRSLMLFRDILDATDDDRKLENFFEEAASNYVLLVVWKKHESIRYLGFLQEVEHAALLY